MSAYSICNEILVKQTKIPKLKPADYTTIEMEGIGNTYEYWIAGFNHVSDTYLESATTNIKSDREFVDISVDIIVIRTFPNEETDWGAVTAELYDSNGICVNQSSMSKKIGYNTKYAYTLNFYNMPPDNYILKFKNFD